MTDDISDRHTEEIKRRFPEPLCYILIELSERNREHWLNGADWREGTIGHESVQDCGLTTCQLGLAEATADLMEATDE